MDDDMDIDSVVDVPDTPDRLTAQMNKGKSRRETRNNLSASDHSGHCNHFVDDTRNGLKVGDKGKRKLLIHAPKRVLSSSKCESPINLAFPTGNSHDKLSNNSLIFRKFPGEIPNYENKPFLPREDHNKRLHTPSSAVDVVDLTEQDGHAQVGKRDYSCKIQGNIRAEAREKNPPLTFRLPSSRGTSNSTTSLGANKGKASVFDSDGETRSKAVKNVLKPLNSDSSPRITGQKRLVRNGCISPNNVSKTKQVGIEKNGDIDFRPDLHTISSAPRVGVGVTESNAQDIDSHKSKGKGILTTRPLSVEESDAQKTHARNPVSAHDIVKGVGESNTERFRSQDDFGGWRSMRNQSKKMNFPMFDEHQNLSSGKDDPCLGTQLPGNGATGRKIQTRAGTSDHSLMGQDSTSAQNASLPPPRHTVPNLRPQLDQSIEQQAARNMLGKTKKQGSSSRSLGESSGVSNSDIKFLGSSRNTSRSRSSSTQNRSHNRLSFLEPVIENEEASPGNRRDGSSDAVGNTPATDAMASQIEADEMLALELQEQFYNEVPSAGASEDDMHVAMGLHEESLTRAFPGRSLHVFSPRSSLMPSSTRQPQLRSPQNLPRRTLHARGPTFSRMARLRNRFPGRARTIASSSSSRDGNPVFPPDMDVDMRMYILEALEVFNDMGVDNNFLHTHRDFNENDYEMLLALDENNHQHAGATDRQINGLPQSTVQNDNFEEACAVCLETPTIGDVIRHLPCLHKFHKDCIDPWLRRKASCPVCKSAIT